MDQDAETSTYRIGRAVVTRVHELSLGFPAATLLPGCDGDPDASLALRVHSWLVHVDGLTVLVDAGVGNGKRRAAAGARPEDVTHVLLTHLHTDHVGWNTMPRPDGWVPTSPNAVTWMPRAGYDFFDSPEGRARPNHDMIVDPDGAVSVPGFTYIPTPGHSRDHMSILLRSEGCEALFAGDMLHHPDQVAHPHWCSMFCERPDEARRSRRRMLGLAADRSLIWFSSHCPQTSVGRVRRTADDFAWSFV